MGVFGDQALLPAADVVNIDARAATDIADIDDRSVIGRIARRERERLAVRDKTVVGAVRIHDRELLAAVSLGARFGDIGDAAIEKRRFARQARIDRVGAFVCRAAPIGGLDDIALADQLAAQCDIVEIAADGKVARCVGANKALDQHFGAAAAPIGQLRRGHLAKADRADTAGAKRTIQAAAFEVAADDLGDLAAQRSGIARRGR